MKLRTLVLFFLMFSGLQLLAQKNIEPTPQDVIDAKKLREQFPKSDVAILKSSETISFDLNKNEAKVIVNTETKEQLMNINHRADIRKYEFYDTESEIKSFSLKYRNDKNANPAVIDEMYKDNDLFYNDARVKYANLSFPIQGYSYNYEVKKQYNDVKYFTSLYFNDEHPVIEKEFSITVPTWLNLELKEFNFEGNSIKKSQSVDPETKAVTYKYTMLNVPALFQDENAPGRSYLYPHVLVIAKSFKNKENQVTLFNSTADLYKWYSSLVGQMNDDNSFFKAKVNELTANAKTDEEKIKNIYYWVQDNIRYIAFEDGIAGFKPDDSQNVFNKRYGDCKGMGNLIKQMLTLAGFDARLTWIGTKHIAYDYTTPSLAVDNHMICTLFFKGKKYFLDGTEKFNSFGEYAERIQNKEVMIENGDKFLIEKVPSVNSEFNKEIFKASLKIVDGKLEGACSRIFAGESRAQLLYRISSLKSDKKDEILERYLTDSDKNIKVNNIKNSDLKNRDQKLTMDYDIAVNNRVSDFDNEMYVDLEYMNEYKNFELKDRKTDYEFDYKTNYESNVSLAIPAGYKVTKIPENLTINENNFSVNVQFVQSESQISYKKSFIFKNGVIKANEIEKWNSFVKDLQSNYNQHIVLSKI
ncbi:transglutaminase-like domain-containing protein [Flavobacterium tegetincola]|uniref:transglutaminase-like domain-containing protein n=1 Tax=Flavobacterium tegetincola TaxID=150172 RepID=UPI0003F90772|nr:transglutaminase-like domain-containing protein [Flavobacterium tegetincola]